MLMRISLLSAVLATQALAQNLITYNCSIAQKTCQQDVEDGKVAQSVCDRKIADCESCVTQEHSCRVGAADNYQANLGCTVAAQTCYEMALSPGSTNGYYGCEEAFDSCSGAYMTNHSFCASQKGGCEACREEENECRTAPDANQSLCSSKAGGCFSKAMSL